MKYIALLRGINVGGKNHVEMGKLRGLFEAISCTNISTYINSGNVLFESEKSRGALHAEIEEQLACMFDFSIPFLIKTSTEIHNITCTIPPNWQNDAAYKADVAYLFDEIDSKGVLHELPFDHEYVDARYTKGALFWRVDRKVYHKSKLNKLVNHKSYKLMTIRNVNTARYLASAR